MDRRHFCQQLMGSSIILGSLSGLVHAQTGSSSKLKWQKSLKTAQKMALQQDKPIMIVFGATWCTYCHKLERETLGDKRTAAYIEREFVPVLLDYNKDSKVAEILEVEHLPCTVILTPDADLILKLEGYRDAKEYQANLAAALEKRADIQQTRSTTTGK